MVPYPQGADLVGMLGSLLWLSAEFRSSDYPIPSNLLEITSSAITPPPPSQKNPRGQFIDLA